MRVSERYISKVNLSLLLLDDMVKVRYDNKSDIGSVFYDVESIDE